MSQPQYQSQLFYHWVRQETLHYANQQQIILQSNYEDDQSYVQFVKSGLVKRLLKEVDQSYFNGVRINFQSKQTQQDQVKMYWKCIDGYLRQKYSKTIRRDYLRQQLDMDRQLTSRHHIRGNTQPSKLERSIEELLRVVFYMLVQKHNPQQQQRWQQRQSIEYRQSLQMSSYVEQEKGHSCLDQTCSSTSLKQSCRSMAATQAQSSATVLLSTQSPTQAATSSSQLHQSQQSLHIICQQQQQQQYQMQVNGFLSRICDLSKQVQQNLMMVVEGIEQMQVMVNVQDDEQQYDNNDDIYDDQYSYEKMINTNGNDQQNFRHIIYKKLQSIQQQNQLYQTKIQAILQQNNCLQHQLQTTYNQQTHLTNKIAHYQQQKQQLYNYLNLQHNINISSLQQFIEVIRHYDQENQLLENTIAEIQQKNYELERENANRVHEIKNNAAEITKISEDINKFRTKIKLLKEDIQYLDQWVNCNEFNAQMVTSVDLGAGQQSLDEPKQFEFQVNPDDHFKVSTSFDHALRENNAILNAGGGYNNPRLSLKLPQAKLHPCHTRMLTQSPSTPFRYSLQPKPYRHSPSNQQNINPLLEQPQLSYQPSKSLSHISFTQQQQSDEILNQKQKYRQELVKNLEGLYKEIADLTQEVTKVKEDNKLYEGKCQTNNKKISKLKTIHQAFLKQAFVKN